MRTIATNKRAYFDYFISDKYEAGISLVGSEVKSVRKGGISLNESFVRILNGEVFLINSYIKPYENAGNYAPESRRSRKLLLNRREITSLQIKFLEKGLTIVPLGVYLKGNLVKVEIGVGKGKKLYDKRETLKDQSAKREIEKAEKNFKNSL